MAESTLALTRNELEGAIGWFLGFGYGLANGDTAWTTQQQAMITAARRAGLRSFYTASAGLMDGTDGYEWSFLRPQASLALASGGNTVQLPEDYQGIEGRLSITSSATTVYRPVPVVGIGLVQEQYARMPSLTGWPMMCAIQPIRAPSAIKGQRFQLYFYPLADQAYTVVFQYHINPQDISTEMVYPYGGAAHSETIIAACLAAAEQRQDDAAGVQTQRYQALLQGSIALDRRNKPQLNGYCGDNSDQPARFWDRRQEIYETDAVLFNGVQY